MNRFNAIVEECFQLIDIRFLAGGDEDAIVVQLRHPSLLQLLQRDILALDRREVVLLFWDIGEGVNLVEDYDTRDLRHGLLGLATCFLLLGPWVGLFDFGLLGKQFVDGLLHHFVLLLEVRVRYIHYVDQQVSLAHLIQRGLEGLHQVVGQLADESHGVGE